MSDAAHNTRTLCAAHPLAMLLLRSGSAPLSAPCRRAALCVCVSDRCCVVLASRAHHVRGCVLREDHCDAVCTAERCGATTVTVVSFPQRRGFRAPAPVAAAASDARPKHDGSAVHSGRRERHWALHTARISSPLPLRQPAQCSPLSPFFPSDPPLFARCAYRRSFLHASGDDRTELRLFSALYSAVLRVTM